MTRIVCAVLLGAVAASAVFFLTGLVAERASPTPPELLDPQTPEAVAARVDAADANGLMLLILGSALGGFCGGFIGAAVAQRATAWVASSTAALLSLWGFYSFYVFYPARLWFPAGLFAGFVLFTFLGSRAAGALAARRRPSD